MRLPGRIANRHARSLADVAEGRSESNDVKNELGQFARIFAPGTKARRVFNAPTVPKKEKRAALERIIEHTRPLETTANFLRALLENHRLTHLAEIVEASADELDRRAGVVADEISAARPAWQVTSANESSKPSRERSAGASARAGRPNLISSAACGRASAAPSSTAP